MSFQIPLPLFFLMPGCLKKRISAHRQSLRAVSVDSLTHVAAIASDLIDKVQRLK